MRCKKRGDIRRHWWGRHAPPRLHLTEKGGEEQRRVADLSVIAPLMKQAQTNLTGNARDLWVTGIRNIRGEMDISPAKEIPVLFWNGSDSDREKLERLQL